MRAQLRDLAANFDRVMLSHGRYVPYPAIADERGVIHVPPRVPMANTSRAALAIAAAGATMAVVATLRNRTPGSAAG